MFINMFEKQVWTYCVNGPVYTVQTAAVETTT